MIEVERRTAADSERVWELLRDIDHWGQMLPVDVGSRFRVLQPGLPTAVYEITDWQPGKGFSWTSSAVGVRIAASHWLAPADGGALLALGIEWSGRLAGIVRALLGAKTRRMVALAADTFVRLAEHAAPRG